MAYKKNLERALLLQSMAQTGLAFSSDPFDIERYVRIRSIAAEMASEGCDNSQEEIEACYEMEGGYATPKVDVRGVVFREGKILLVKERADGLWTLPGGWADVGDTPSEAVEREVLEESGFQTQASKLLAVLDRNRQGHPFDPFHIYKLFFLCEITGGEAASGDETSEVGFFGEGNLPEMSVQRVMPAQVELMFEHFRHPERATDFD
jgi:ADP-ribose pyrophosphatase YjhB (NUDIX family)